MDKETKKRNKYNEKILEAVSKRYGVTIDYVRKCLRGDRSGIVPDRISKDYKEGVKELNEVVDETVEKITNK
ncbi:hypothetical protein R1T16_17315 [Flavobacterium sp. DG1-102-2]|uniref:hypothetical protein n=1 Tax=Flavobacterium sp. DG1-102-2 TaxID=3081663 RepID=UPI002949865A|nr:hypothetical protein [Flavobacterium sp. DG1-102-2]MDV6170199.1 hypothetical protein [Flavobacterium sp. DG1-102-2]